MTETDAANRRSFNELLFSRPASVPRWAVGQVLHPDTVFSAAVVLVLLVPVAAGLLLFHAELRPPATAAGAQAAVPWLLVLAGSFVALLGIVAVASLGLGMKRMAHELAGSDIILRIISDQQLFDDDERLSARLKQLDYAYLGQDTPFSRARITGYELPYFLGIRSRPGVPTIWSTLALCGLPLVFTLLLLSPQEFGEGSVLRALLLLVASIAWQWGFHQLLMMTAGLGALQQHVLEMDRNDLVPGSGA